MDIFSGLFAGMYDHVEFPAHPEAPVGHDHFEPGEDFIAVPARSGCECGEVTWVAVTPKQADALLRLPVQAVLAHFLVAEREAFITGTHPACEAAIEAAGAPMA